MLLTIHSNAVSDDFSRFPLPPLFSESVLVYEGDSVWSIAKDHLKNADEEQLTSYVEEIKEINNISQEGMIYAGRYLILPIYEKIEAI